MSHDNLGGSQGQYLYPCWADKEAEAKELDNLAKITLLMWVAEEY